MWEIMRGEVRGNKGSASMESDEKLVVEMQMMFGRRIMGSEGNWGV